MRMDALVVGAVVVVAALAVAGACAIVWAPIDRPIIETLRVEPPTCPCACPGKDGGAP